MLVFVVIAVSAVATTANPDSFNYASTHGNNYGPSDWGRVTCGDLGTCPGWPDNWEQWDPRIPFKETVNSCLDCRIKRKLCQAHKQSPISLFTGFTSDRICHDRHKMVFKDGDCARFTQMNFTVERHGVRAMQPLLPDGNSICSDPSNIDFSMGFPDPWHLLFTDIKVPSEHVLEGKRYDAEVVLSHEYSHKGKNESFIGNVAILLEAGNDTDFYDFLDLYLRRWKKEQKRVFEFCQISPRNETLSGNTTTSTPYVANASNRALQVTESFRRRFSPYDWLKKVATEYYFRYEGSLTVPPCFAQSVHWRVMKNSIRVAPDQIRQLEDLIANRVNPTTCIRDTAGVMRNNSIAVDVNRPIQSLSAGHKAVFCECIDWESSMPNDVAWCNRTMEERGVKPYWKLLRNK